MAAIVFYPGALNKLFNSPEGPTAKLLEQKAIQVERTAKHLCPYRSGRLRASITHGLGVDAKGLFAVVGTNVEYAPYVELGTSRMAAQPFLRPALKAVK